MTKEERNTKLKHFITCLKCEVSGKECDANCHVQYEAGNMGEIVENLEAISKVLEQEPCEDAISRSDMLDAVGHGMTYTSEELQKIIKALPPVNAQQKYEDIAKAFQFGMAFGFGEKHNKMDKVINEITKVITPQPKTGHWIAHEVKEIWHHLSHRSRR